MQLPLLSLLALIGLGLFFFYWLYLIEQKRHETIYKALKEEISTYSPDERERLKQKLRKLDPEVEYL